MLKSILPFLILLLIIGTIMYVSRSFISSQTQNTPQTQSTQQTQNPQQIKAQAPTLPIGVTGIKMYAAYQLDVPQDKVTILNVEKQSWDDICLGLKIPNYDCKKVKTSGYEAKVDVNGRKITYRGNENGSIIRVVK